MPTTTIENPSTSNIFVPTSTNWESGSPAANESTGSTPSTRGVNPQIANISAIATDESITYENGTDYEYSAEEVKRMRMPSSIIQDRSIQVAKRRTAWQNTSKRNEMLNEDQSIIQNGEGFPFYYSRSSGMNPARYDYQIIPGDSRSKTMVSLEDKLQAARASLGIQVHGNNEIGRAVKYYMYNRFKVPDTNLAFNKMTTHVFFTRPDLNLLRCGNGLVYGPTSQVINHSDTSLLYKTNPYLFKLLTDSNRCGDSNNFNLLLSNQISSFNIEDEMLESTEVGKSWSGSSIFYGDRYSAKRGGEFSCTFTELQDLSIIKLMKLWLMYIDNVSSGAWSPSYDLHGNAMLNKYGNYTAHPQFDPVDAASNASHVYSKTLDYAASAYVFKCGPDGEDVLYWTKYFGVFPINTGASALSWDMANGIGDSQKLTINFKYSFKRDLSPISLIEFNCASGIEYMLAHDIPIVSESSFNPNYNHSSRPYVGAPFVEFSFGSKEDNNDKEDVNVFGNNADMFGKDTNHIRLKFHKTGDSKLSDDLLYRSSMMNRNN